MTNRAERVRHDEPLVVDQIVADFKPLDARVEMVSLIPELRDQRVYPSPSARLCGSIPSRSSAFSAPGTPLRLWRSILRRWPKAASVRRSIVCERTGSNSVRSINARS